MSLRVRNKYPKPISVMIEWHHPNCPDGGDWRKAGWWNVQPGAVATVYGNDVDDVNRFWYFFAQATDGATWSGPISERVPSHAFELCASIASNMDRFIGMREFDVDSNSTYTLNLTG
jgi:uncharacterized membrane protein